MARITMNELTAELTPEEIRELEAAEKMPPVFDEDSPEMTAEQLLQFKRMNHENRIKQTVSLRLSPDTLKKAKQYGKGYTSFLSRLLDAAIDDEELVRKCI
ncbi:MAG: BrnA antitoxin family protein [Clostridia bacterium]|nr:BrnA antitoxin family protein [Clostridia bacterium]MBQ9039671.1 BrnA antitoxin family protein [Clostridia bacterium]